MNRCRSSRTKAFDSSGKAVAGHEGRRQSPRAEVASSATACCSPRPKRRTCKRSDGVRQAAAQIGRSRCSIRSSRSRLWKERESADKVQVAIITRQLGALLRAGVPLAESLGALSIRVERPGSSACSPT